MNISKDDVIFATGVFLKPIECIINNEKQWRWIAVNFEDDSFLKGISIDVFEYSDTFNGLFEEDDINSTT